ncbi:Eco57I restriction-modification methylase domain-containing protein, partial [Planktothrix sp.]
MSERCLQLDDLRTLENPEKIANLFKTLGYNASSQPLDINDLQLSPRNCEAIYDAYLIADQGDGGLQVLLFQLHPEEWLSPSVASTRIKSIAAQVGRRATEFLLLATKDYNQLMLVNCRKSFDENNNVKASIRKLLIDRTNPTAYDRDRLEAIAVRNLSPQKLYQVHCEAFDVEKLTKSFYKGYKQLFDNVQKVIKDNNPHPYFNDPDRLHQFSQRLLGRIMFIYFLQKKEFLSGDSKFLTTRYKVLKANPDDTDYYSEVLEHLFFNTLNQFRPNLQHRWGEGKIPYLNGGLFDRDYGVGIKDAAGRDTPETITLPNSLFDPGESGSILSFFNGYNFTISENVAGDEDVAVDPEMLGKVFENMLAAEERGQSGTFYTPRGIVQFMCVEVLSRYLADESGMELETVRKLIDYDPDQLNSYYHNLMTPQQAKQLKQALKTIKVLDPAVGSGAFPLGMMQALLQVRQAIARREGTMVQRGSLTISQWKREIIANNLYGVDIKPEAIEIAKLRMWLSLVVDIPDIEDVEPLPNLDYKLMCGDSLISTIHGEHLIPDPTKTQQLMLAVTPIQLAIQPLLELQRRYFDAQTEERHQLREQILAAEANVFRVAVADRRLFWEGKQRELERKIQTMKGKVSKAQEKERAEIGEKLMELDRFATEVESGERSLNFFQYHLHFRDVFEGKGGFDCVIGNPPYVRADSGEQYLMMRKEIEASGEYETLWEKWDLYVAFIEKGYKLLKKKGLVTMIVSDAFCHAKYAQNSQNWFIKNSKIIRLDFLGKLQFFDASVKNIIFLFENNDGANNRPLRLVHNQHLENTTALQTDTQNNLTCRAFFPEDNDILSFKNTVRLEEICYISKGMVVNAHEKLAKGAFKLKDLLSPVKDKIHPKKFVEGKDIDKWLPSSHKWLEWGTSRSPDLLSRPTFPELYEQDEKILLVKIGNIKTAFDNQKLYGNEGIFVCILWHQLQNVRNTSIKKYARYKDEKPHPDLPNRELLENNSQKFNLKYILAITNSSLARYFLSVNRRNNIQLYPEDWKQLPVCKATKEEQEQLIKLVDKILTAKQFNPDADTSQLEA